MQIIILDECTVYGVGSNLAEALVMSMKNPGFDAARPLRPGDGNERGGVHYWYYLTDGLAELLKTVWDLPMYGIPMGVHMHLADTPDGMYFEAQFCNKDCCGFLVPEA